MKLLMTVILMFLFMLPGESQRVINGVPTWLPFNLRADKIWQIDEVYYVTREVNDYRVVIFRWHRVAGTQQNSGAVEFTNPGTKAEALEFLYNEVVPNLAVRIARDSARLTNTEAIIDSIILEPIDPG